VLEALEVLERAATPCPVRGPAERAGGTGRRADNVLITPGGVALVDRPWACRGPRWPDRLLLLTEVDRHGGQHVGNLLAATPVTHHVDPDDLTAVLAGFAGFFLDMARRDPPPDLPTLGEFQRVQGDALLARVRRRVATSAT
jgi:hypothetical protein